MERINGADWVDIGGGKHGFRDLDLAAGLPGTEVTAAFLNGVQEEILKVIESAGFAASGADLGQLARAIQSGAMNTANAGGTVNAYTAALTPAPSAYKWGLLVSMWFATPNTGAATLNLNGLGALPILSADGAPVTANDLKASVTLICVGTSFVVLNVFTASEFSRGVVQLATAAETTAGSNTNKPASVGRMAPAVQSGSWNYIAATGTATALVATLVPAPTALAAGLAINLKITAASTGPATLNVNGLGAKSIVNSDGSAIAAGDFDVNGIVTMIYNGTNFVVSNVSQATETSRGVVELASAAEATAGTDLTRPASVGRMAPAVQSGSWNYAVAAGTANAITAALTPAPAALTVGMVVDVKIASANTSTTPTLNVNGLGAATIVGNDGSAIPLNALVPGLVASFEWDGTNWRYLNFTALQAPPRNIQIFSAAGTTNFTVPAGVYKIEAEGWAGGGGGGGVGSSGGTGGGGGGGEYFSGWFDVTPGQVIPVTVGAGGAAGAASTTGVGGTGGTTSLGALATAIGGGGGGNNTAGGGSPGSGGSGGQFRRAGGGGYNGAYLAGNASYAIGGNGAPSFNQSIIPAYVSGSAVSGFGPGSGGSGAGYQGSAIVGAAGAAGQVIIRY
ncbi:hypothetical protein [Rhizobium mayense]|uniref:Glycine-rich domain-containing protein n=1 Tax=Rhizobium mayense TaxID=1312184 RepID=A0ABT7JY56_9HYPH|nr:hypothetical protein [Rhizobium mayense]MDL2401242.1 hypothetical protein [Rhizobium mayense]